MSDRVRWIRSYVVHEPDGRIGTFCIYEARDGESIREHARRVGMPGDEFYKVATTVVVRGRGRKTGRSLIEADRRIRKTARLEPRPRSMEAARLVVCGMRVACPRTRPC